MSFAAYIPVGPNPIDLDRLADLLDSLAVWGSGLRWIVLIDDGVPPRRLLPEFHLSAGTELVTLSNPRIGIGDGTRGGLCVANLLALEHIYTRTSAVFVLKLDTDSLLISPLLEKILRLLEPDVGLIGVVGDSFAAERQYTGIATNATIFRHILTLPEDLSTVMLTDDSMLRRRGLTTAATCGAARALVRQAESNRAALGEYCQGGAYVVSRQLLTWLSQNGHFHNPLLWRDVLMGEDVLMGLFCGAAGLRIRDASQPGQPFAVDQRALTLTGAELVTRQAAIIHSVRGAAELTLRDYFRARRMQQHLRQAT